MKRSLHLLPVLLLSTFACRALTPASPASPPLPPTATPTPPAPALDGPVSTGLPDLTADQYAVRYFGCPWTEGGEVRGRVRNLGTGRAAAFEVEINGARAGVDGLESGAEAFPLTAFEKGPVGSIYIAADPDNRLPESDEGNNIYQIMFTPPPPCPTPAGAAARPAPSATAPAPLTFTIRADSLWNQPEIILQPGDVVMIRPLGGAWTYAEAVAPFDGRGNLSEPVCGQVKPGAQCGLPQPNAPTGALLIGLPFTPPMPVGEGLTISVQSAGMLNLFMNADPSEAARAFRSGELIAEITITRR